MTSALEAIQELNRRAGSGRGRIDMVEDCGDQIPRDLRGPRRRGPGIEAHRALEAVTLERMQHRQASMEQTWADLVYEARGTPAQVLPMDAFHEDTRRHVNGDIRMVLHGGRADRQRPPRTACTDFSTWLPTIWEAPSTSPSSRGFIEIYGMQSASPPPATCAPATVGDFLTESAPPVPYHSKLISGWPGCLRLVVVGLAAQPAGVVIM